MLSDQMFGILNIRLLGGFSVSINGKPISALGTDRPQSLFAYLLLHSRTPVSRQQLAFSLWPDSSDEQARTNLRNLLHTLRKGFPEVDRYLKQELHSLQWRPDLPFELDVAEFEEALIAAKDSGDVSIQRDWLEQAITKYFGPLLPGNYEDWLVPLREDLHQAFLDALRQLAILTEGVGDMEAAIRYGRQLLQQDPLAEPAVMLLMKLYVHKGDLTAVRRTYQAYARALKDEFDAEPGKEIRNAFDEAVRLATSAGEIHKGGETASWQRERSSPRQARQLPPQPNPFIGRDAETTRLAQHLNDPHCRLLTIVGPGGSGKTRLALQVAYGHVKVFSDGVAFISLAAVSDPALLPSVIAQGLQFPLGFTNSRTEQLLQYLADREMLLVLDNLEQFGEKVDFLIALLSNAPRLKLLATSRSQLNIPSEWVFPLKGLPIPEVHSFENLSENNAATLFLQSARQHDAEFNTQDKDWAAIVRIIRLVEGMPLGIELAALWVRVLSCGEIAAEIEKNLDFLTNTQRHESDRHRSMRAVFNQSWRMLAETERDVFETLSLFRGGFSREGAERVAGATLTILSDLLKQSIVRRLANGRYDIHEFLRQYAAEQLTKDAERTSSVKDRFGSYYLDLIETAGSQLIGQSAQTWMDQLELEIDNIRQVLEWTITQEDSTKAFRLANALGRFWWLRYRPVEGGNWLRRILEIPGPISEERCRVQTIAGMLARLRRDYEEAETWLVKSLLFQRNGTNRLDLGRTLNELGMLYMDQGAYSRALDYFEEWLAIARDLEYAHGISIALLNLGMANQNMENIIHAEALYQDCLSITLKHEFNTTSAMVYNSYGMLLLETGRTNEARQMFRDSIQINLDLDNIDGLSWGIFGMLVLEFEEGHLERAAQFTGVLESVRDALGATLPPANQAYLEGIVQDLARQLGGGLLAAQRERGREIGIAGAVQMVGL